MTAEEMLHHVNVEPLGGAARTHGVARRLPWFA